MKSERTSREGKKLIPNMLWLPEKEDARAVKWSKKSKPHKSKHAMLLYAITLGFDTMERKA